MNLFEDADAALDAWDGESLVELGRRWGVADLRVFERVGSTNDVVRDWALRGTPAWSVVLAEHQTEGRGRNRKSWTSTPGSSIAISVLVPALGPEDAMPLKVGLAVAEAIEEVAPELRPELKWPNDVLLDRRKVAGILCETAYGGQVVVGIGINVSQAEGDFPSALSATVTSLVLALPQDAPRPRRSRLVAALLSRLRAHWDAPESDWRLGWERRDALRGREVECSNGPRGEVVGCDTNGALLVRSISGRVLPVISGSVHVRDERANH